MTRLTFPGATYTSAQPDGAVARVYADRIETTEQRVDFPGEGVLALVSRRYNDFLYLSGQGQGSGQAWLWGPTGWHPMGYSHGVSPCAFGTDSLFFAASPESYRRVRLDTGEVTDHVRQIGSQGIRYVEGETVVTGDETIYDGTVHEFTDRGDVRGGQSSIDGYLLNGKDLGWVDEHGTFRREGGNVQFCRLERDGDQLAVSLVKFLEGQGVVYLLTRVEVDALPPPPVPPPDPVLQPPKVTILEWDSLMKAGVPWHARFTTGAIDTVEVSKDAQDRLTVRAVNVAGSDQTGSVRQLTVEGPSTPEPEPEPLPMLGRFWLQPNIGSLDQAQILGHLEGVDVVTIPVQQIHADVTTDQIGPNTYPNLVAAGFFQKLKDAGIPLVVEMGSVKDGDCQAQANINGMQWAVQRVADAGGVIAGFSADEPLTNSRACHQSMEATADGHAAWTHAIRALGGMQVGWLEGWPDYTTLADFQTFAHLLQQLDALPDYLHVDIYHDHSTDAKTATFLHGVQQLANQYGFALGIFVNSTKDPIATDAQHHQNLLALAHKLSGMCPDIAHVCVAAWAHRVSPDPTHKTQNVPNNLGVNGLLHTFTAVRPFFETVVPPQPEPEMDPMLYKLMDPTTRGVIRVKSLKALDGGKFTAILPDDRVVSIQPDGSFETRDAGTEGEYEQCYAADGLLFYAPQQKLYSYAYRLLPA